MLDPKIVILCLNTEWSRRQGLTSTNKDGKVVFQTGNKSSMKCDNCNQSGHIKSRCWAKDRGQEGQYPKWFKGRKDQHTSKMVKAVRETLIVWAYGSASRLDVWFVDSAATVHVSSNHEYFTTYRTYTESPNIKAFGNNAVKGIGKGDIVADIEFQGKTSCIHFSQVIHVPGAKGKILYLKLFDQKGFECQI